MDNNYQSRLKKTLKRVESSDRTEMTPKFVNKELGPASGGVQMTPATVQALPQRLKNLGLDVSPELENVVEQYPEEKDKTNIEERDRKFKAIRDLLNKNPNLDDKVTDDQIELLTNKYPNDVLKAAYSHHTGQAPPNEVSKLVDTPSDPGYMKKFLRNYEQSSPDTNILDREKFGRTKDLFAARDQRLANRIKSGEAFIPKPVIPTNVPSTVPTDGPVPEPLDSPIDMDPETVASNDSIERFKRLRGSLK